MENGNGKGKCEMATEYGRDAASTERALEHPPAKMLDLLEDFGECAKQVLSAISKTILVISVQMFSARTSTVYTLTSMGKRF